MRVMASSALCRPASASAFFRRWRAAAKESCCRYCIARVLLTSATWVQVRVGVGVGVRVRVRVRVRVSVRVRVRARVSVRAKQG